MKRNVISLALSLFCFANTAECALAKLNIDSFKQQVSTVAKSFKGRLGVGVVDLQTGDCWYMNGTERFRMMSVVKILVAIAALKKVDDGKLQLDQDIPLTRVQVQKIKQAAIPDPISLKAKSATLSSLLERSVCRSNNGAVDVITKLLGGPEAVTAYYKNARVSGIHIDGYESEAAECSTNRTTDVTDTATPQGVCDVLSKLQTGKLLSKQSTNYLLDLMRKCETGEHRIRAGVPKDWVVRDKTGTGKQVGTVNVATNDVAIITTPTNSNLVMAVFVGDATLSGTDCEKKIADVAKALADAEK